MKNLGKIILFLILTLSSLGADVTAKVSPKDVFTGDTATYSLTISGSNVNKPVLSDICGNDITATGSQTSIESINGAYKKSYTLSYQFTPQKSCSIDPVAVEIDGKTEYSNSVKLTVLPRTQNLGADFVLELASSKKELFVGEPFTLTLLLKQKRGAQAVDSQFKAPDFKGFWLKSESKPERSQDSTHVITKITYELAPQREGNLSIVPAELKIASRVGVNNWGTLIPQVRWRTYYSNEINLQIKALPNNAKIIGDFSINAAVDKRSVNPNEAVNLTLEIKGSGNFEDIESFKPFIADVNVFDEKIKLFKNGLKQKIVFVSDQDFTIPSFELRYFDNTTQKIKTIQTQPIAIKVKGAGHKKEVQITRDETPDTRKAVDIKEKLVVEKNNFLYIGAAFLLGIILGVLGMKFKRSSPSKKTKKIDIKDEKALLIKLLPYKDSDAEVAEIVTHLENNIYSKEKIKIDKKKIKEILKRYDIV